jgi:hypothetical protein
MNSGNYSCVNALADGARTLRNANYACTNVYNAVAGAFVFYTSSDPYSLGVAWNQPGSDTTSYQAMRARQNW